MTVDEIRVLIREKGEAAFLEQQMVKVRTEPIPMELADAIYKAELDPEATKPTDRELAALALMAMGHTRKQAGRVLFMSEEGIKSRLARTRQRLRVRTTTEAVAISIRSGWL